MKTTWLRPAFLTAGCALLLLGCAEYSPRASSARVDALTCEHEVDPMGIGVARPRLSWQMVSDQPGEMQTAYEVRAASSAEGLSRPDLWSSGKVSSDQSVLVRWGGAALGSRAIVYWQVRVWDKDGAATAWSAPAHFELGLLDAAREWKGQWITSDLPRYDLDQSLLAGAQWINAGSSASQGVGIRLDFDLPPGARVEDAEIDAGADGLISLYVNGKATLQGPSSHTAPFHADFGQQLAPGRNVIALGALPVRTHRGPGGRNAIAARAVIHLAGGRRIVLVTDGSWKAAILPPPPFPNFGGEAALAQTAPGIPTWHDPDFDDSAWAQARVLGPYSEADLVSSADPTLGPGRYLRKDFEVRGPVARARLYATALGVYEASIDGQPVSGDQLSPGWTDYTKRVMVQTYDVTGLLKPGANTLGALLGDGWFAGRVGWMGRAQYAQIGTRPDFNAQLEITYADGSRQTIATDGSWQAGSGEVVGSDLQIGELDDARRAAAWNVPGFASGGWPAAVVERHEGIELDPQIGPPVRRLMELPPRNISRMGDMWIVDLGQNMVGHLRLTAQGKAGDRIEVLHGEMLNPDGTVYNENLRQAISFDSFILAGTGQPETFEPHFTFHGFRYVQITGYPGELRPEDIRGIVVGSDTPDTGRIDTSDPDVNQLVSNIRWGQRGNFLSVPTDCPQRDERQGWMGDAQVFAPTAAYNADVDSFFTQWMVDVDDGQLTSGPGAGGFCVTSPRVANDRPAYPIWGDAGVIIPWVMYTTYGDRGFLQKNYENMARWVDYCQRTFPDLIEYGGVGDNLSPIAGRGRPVGARPARPAGGFAAFGAVGSTTSVLDTEYFAHSAWIVSRAAALLGRSAEAARYEDLFHRIDQAFLHAYVHPDGTMVSGTQSTYVVAIAFDLLPGGLREKVGRQLIDDVEARGHLSTGFVGVGFINPVLCSIGRPDLAYRLLLNTTYPSWLFPVKEGATTIWERWDGYTPQRGFQASSMNSFNHYSLGSVGKWLYAGAGGIRIDDAQPGFKHFFLAPQLSPRFGFFRVSFDSPYGKIRSEWRQDGENWDYLATVPPNSSATLELPVPPQDVQRDGRPLAAGPGPATRLDLPAGTYTFSFPQADLR